MNIHNSITGSARKALEGSLCYVGPGYRAPGRVGEPVEEEARMPELSIEKLSATHLFILRAIEEHGIQTTTDIAKLVNTTYQGAGKILNEMIRRGWIVDERGEHQQTNYTLRVELV